MPEIQLETFLAFSLFIHLYLPSAAGYLGNRGQADIIHFIIFQAFVQFPALIPVRFLFMT